MSSFAVARGDDDGVFNLAFTLVLSGKDLGAARWSADFAIPLSCGYCFAMRHVVHVFVGEHGRQTNRGTPFLVGDGEVALRTFGIEIRL
jgi:hypothetical protein